jgi:hypothetical protein
MATEEPDNNRHRLFLQFIMSKRIVLKDIAKDFLSSIHVEDSLLDYIRDVNTKLTVLDLRITTGHDPIQGLPMICLVNLNSDEIAKVATAFNSIEIVFFRKLVLLLN